jgi:hypothetical protein
MSNKNQEKRPVKPQTPENFDRDINGKQVRIKTLGGDLFAGRCYVSKYYFKVISPRGIIYIPKGAISFLEIEKESEVKI